RRTTFKTTQSFWGAFSYVDNQPSRGPAESDTCRDLSNNNTTLTSTGCDPGSGP
ncbi:Hypothetical predicted protein, partial [Paramuricea clavata]